MVRLEVRKQSKEEWKYLVSIPIWCDWKLEIALGMPQSTMFQFLYGAIGSSFELPLSPTKVCFNSYMVRLEEAFDLKAILFCAVSIPIWCDWKMSRACDAPREISFNSYMVRLEVARRKNVWH